MKELFNIESPFMQLLTRVGDLIIVNFLFLVCCVPLVTVGASAAALHRRSASASTSPLISVVAPRVSTAISASAGITLRPLPPWKVPTFTRLTPAG